MPAQSPSTPTTTISATNALLPCSSNTPYNVGIHQPVSCLPKALLSVDINANALNCCSVLSTTIVEQLNAADHLSSTSTAV
jgi:hypothetical protein